MSDYKIDAATKEEWALRAWSAEAKLAEAVEAFESILKIPDSDAAQGVMKVFACAALREIGGVANG